MASLLVKGIDTAMAERAEREPTLEEIVVALRETRRGAGRAPPFTVVGGQHGNRTSSTASRSDVDARNGPVVAADIGDLRDGEIELLLTENTRLNKRIVFLLKIIERDRARIAELAASKANTETDQSGISDEVSKALEAELRPVLLVLLRLLQAQRANHEAASAPGTAAHPTPSDGASHDAAWVVDLDALRD